MLYRLVPVKFPLHFLPAILLPAFACAQSNYPPEIEGATDMVYKTVGDVDLKLWRFYPDEAKPENPLPAVIFFFGGGWTAGSPKQFVPQSQHLAEKNIVAFVADYRVASRHGTKAKDCVADARDAMRYLHEHAKELGIDPDRVAAGGGSAGGHIAACLGVIEDDENSKPDAMILFNPALVIAPFEGKNYWDTDRSEEMQERMGVEPEALSPIHHVSKSAPPCIIFHGEADDTVPFSSAAIFAEKMVEAGVVCELKGYPGQEHGFFNRDRKPEEQHEKNFAQTMKEMDEFLVQLGWMDEPESSTATE